MSGKKISRLARSWRVTGSIESSFLIAAVDYSRQPGPVQSRRDAQDKGRLPRTNSLIRLESMSERTKKQPGKKSNRKSAAPAKTDAHKVLLLDGHSLAFRAFFALPDTLVTSSGQVTNAVYGFTSMLIKLLADERPQGVVVCFDKGAPR